MKAGALRLQDVEYKNQWFDELEDRWEFADFRNHPAWRKG